MVDCQSGDVCKASWEYLKNVAMFEAAAERAAIKLSETNQVEDALTDCVEQLSPDDREMVERRYELDASVQAIAHQQERSIHAIYRSLARIHSILFDCVSAKLAAEDA